MALRLSSDEYFLRGISILSVNALTALLSQANGRKSGAKGKRNATKTVLPDEKRIQQTSKRSRSNTKYGLTEAKKLLG